MVTSERGYGSTRSPIPQDFPPALRDHGVLVPTGGDGLFGWDERLERVFVGLERAITDRGRDPGTRVLRFPPVLLRRVFEQSRFARSFGQLFGSVHAFDGDPHHLDGMLQAMEEGADWGDSTDLTDYVLAPAACYPVYPLYQGLAVDEPVSVDVAGFCFRHEPSTQPGRLVTFRQREFVVIGNAAVAEDAFRRWQQRALTVVRDLGIEAELVTAADPFFGRGGRLLATSQREQGLKFEIMAPIGDQLTAVASCNYHRDHFGETFEIVADGTAAHTTCVGFGQERLAYALVSAHGPDLDRWPDPVRAVLWPQSSSPGC